MRLEPKSEDACSRCGVRTATLCAQLTPAELDQVQAIRQEDQALPPGTTILREGEIPSRYYTVKHGWVMAYSVLSDGRRQVHYFATRGAFIGHLSGNGEPLPYTVETLSDATVCVLPRAAVDKLLLRLPQMAVSLACVLTRCQDRAYEQLTSLGRRDARERVAHLLLDLHHRGVAAAGGSERPVELPLTQQHLADALGLTSVHISRTLKRLRAEGLVDLHKHRLQVLDPKRLEAAAGLESAAAQ